MRLTALALLPALTFIALFLTLRARARGGDARLALLRTGLLTGAYAILATEILSLLDAINRMGLVLAWAAPASLLAIGLVRRPPPWRALLPRLPPERTDRALLLAAIIPLMASAVVAWKAPPQTWDSLNYHMPRVAHWAQNRSLRPFATGIEIQNSRPPGAEILILQTYVLSQGDRWANFVAWLAVAGGVMGASLLARQLGARRRGQILAATVAATIPMALVQASSTMNDALVAFWMVCLANEALALPGRDFRTPALYAALAAGLAIATKPTALAYVLPFALYVTWSLLRLRGGKRLLPLALAALGLALLPNAGSWARNLSLYGSPINPEQAAVHSNALADPRALVSNVLRNASLHASTPWPHVNKGITLVVRAVHHWMGLDINDPRTTAHTKFRVRPLSTHEDLTGNTLHALLILISLVVIVACRRSLGTKVLTHTALVTATFLTLSWLFKWQGFGSRYHLPFFLLFAPLIGLTWASLGRGRWALPLGLGLLAASWPWLLSINSRPLIPRAGISYVDSVLVEPRPKLYFANGLYLEPLYREMTGRITGAGCQQVGLMLAGNAAEYPLWVLLGAPDEALRLEWLVSGSPSAALAPQGFEPCAVICQACPLEAGRMRGLALSFRYATFSLYLTEDESP